MRDFWWVFLLLTLTGVGWGGVPLQAREPDVDCDRASTTVEINYCLGKSYEAADRDLNSLWKRLWREMDEQEKKKYLEAQRAWLKYRDATCEAETFLSIDGTGYGGFLSGCLDRVTRARIEELKLQFQGR
jgi:uncharacterized protein YecT (DUF1311 family)